MISVITPTVRIEGLEIVKKSLQRQTFTDFEWLVGSPSDPAIDNAIWVKDDFKGGVWSLNRIYNKLIKQAKGDLVISLQDYTYGRPDSFERLNQHFIDEPKTLVTAVGNKYRDESWTITTWMDPRKRKDQGSYYPCFWNDIEWNFCSVPKRAIYDVGGFDESLDFKGFGCDGLSVLDRINLIGGYEFKIDQGVRSYSLMHDRPEEWDSKNLIHTYNELREKYLKKPKLSYL